MLSPSQAAKEIIRRLEAKASLIKFTEFTLPTYQTAAHHALIAEKLEAIERGDIDRLMINMPPRHGKSELASRRFPAFFLGRHPEKSIIAASYNSDLATDFGRQVRNIVAQREFANLFHMKLAEDSRAANRWNTDKGGSYVAAGVGTAITGRGANILLIDDPLKDREEADSENQREKIWDWYTSTAYTRLAPNGAIIVIQCMSGDTPVLMATGEEKPLRCVRPGDKIATYDKGKVSTSFVRNWSNNGPDRVYEIRMKSGITVKANARHPFLVATDGGEQWVRTSALKRGDTILRVIGANGAALNASSKGAVSRPNARECATRTMGSTVGVPVIDRLRSILAHGATHISSIATGLAWQSMNAFWPNRAAFAPYAGSLLVPVTRAPIGITSSALTTVTTARGLEDCSATTATWQSATARQPTCSKLPRDTYGIVKDEVVEVVEAGVEDVFDIQVDRTENFIANGLVSHNTRWHEDDLSGRLLQEQAKGGDKWDVLDLPAITSDGRALWPDYYPLEALNRIKSVLPARDWSALYQQKPAPEEGAYYKRDWWRYYDTKPQQLRVYGASDYAVTDGDGDYTVHLVAGVDPDDNIYLLDVWRGQTNSDVWIKVWLDLVRQHKPLMWVEEQGQIIKSIGPFLDKRMREERVYCRREQVASAADKPTRSRSIQARTAMGKVYLPSKAPWLAEFQSELLSFPAGKHDDQVDAFGLIGRMLDDLIKASTPKVEIKRPNDGYSKMGSNGSSSGWKTAT